ncbi:DUF2809 domain-containing protein [Priestia megaterium]|nr:DUF2809 domain-containing protein [Priestia megaterium]
MNNKRNRFVYTVIMAAVMSLGLLSRKATHILPDFLNAYLGDALWALMIFIGFGIVLRSAATKIVATAAISFCYLIEASQLYHAGWIDTIRETALGGLILGYGFLWRDLAAYGIGIGIGIIAEQLYWMIKKT